MAYKKRLDILLLELGFADTREKAQALILSGNVLVDGKVVDKAGFFVKEDQKVEVKDKIRYVSRGGYKLEHAVDRFSLDVRGFVVLDIGSSTGGFTDCLLQRGAKKVYAIDVGRAQMDIRLRHDPKVVLFEEMDARCITHEHVPEQVDLITMDVSFISSTKLLPNVVRFLKENGKLLVLVKPQFELEPKKVPKGVVKSDEYKRDAIIKVANYLHQLGFNIAGVIKSKPKGSKGNEEFFLLAGKTVEKVNLEEAIDNALKEHV